MYNEDFLLPKYTNTLRGILVCFVILHHIYQYKLVSFIHPLIGVLFQNSGFWCVALFFFLSGYGLTYSFINKKDYCITFFKNKFFPLLISYVFFIMLYFVYFFFIQNRIIVYRLWYIEVTLFLYLLIFLSFKYNKICFFVCGIILYLLICFLFEIDIYWYATILLFPFGIFCYRFKNFFDGNIYNNLFVFLISFITFAIVFCSSKLLPNNLMIIKKREVDDSLFILQESCACIG